MWFRGSESRAQGWAYTVSGLGFGVQGFGFRSQRLEFRVEG